MANNKVQLADGTVLMDLTDTTAEAPDVASGKYFYAANGTRTAGTASGGISLLDVYPVGSIYMSVSDTADPAQLFGGTWEPIKGQFLLAAADPADIGTEPDDSLCYRTVGSEGGSERITLTTSQLPAHTHGIKSLVGSVYNVASQSATTNFTYGGIARSANKIEGHGYAVNSVSANDGFVIDASHEHTSVGSGESHGNMPPYLAVYMWKRVVDPTI